MYFKEEIEITEEDRIIIEKLGKLVCLSEKIDGYFYLHDQEFFVQLKLFTSEFNEAYDKGFARYFSDEYYYRWVRNNVISKFTALLEALFKGLLEQFEDVDANGVLTYKNCKGYRTYHIISQSEEQAETTHDVSSRILELNEVELYENGMLEIEDTIVQVMECFHIKVESTESADKVDSKKKKELIQEIRVLIYKRMCALLTENFKRSNCVEEIQYRLMLSILIGVINQSFKPQFKKESYDKYEVAKNVSVELKSEFAYFSGVYAKLRHYKKSLIRL